MNGKKSSQKSQKKKKRVAVGKREVPKDIVVKKSGVKGSGSVNKRGKQGLKWVSNKQGGTAQMHRE